MSAAIVARELRQQGLPDVLETIVTSGDVGYRKPHPLVFESTLERLQLSPEQTVVVGDSYELDIVPAAHLGMLPVLKLNEQAPDPDQVLARHQVSSLAALLHLEFLCRGDPAR